MCFEFPFPFLFDLLRFLYFTVNNRHTHRGQASPTPSEGLPLARHHPSSVGLYKYTIVLILYLFHPLPSFCSRGSSFYILAASAKQLMCTECVDSNCLAIVAPSRFALYAFARGVEGDGGSSCRVQSPRGSSVRFFLRFAINRLSLIPGTPETSRRSYTRDRNKRNESRKFLINLCLDYLVIEMTEDCEYFSASYLILMSLYICVMKILREIYAIISIINYEN